MLGFGKPSATHSTEYSSPIRKLTSFGSLIQLGGTLCIRRFLNHQLEDWKSISYEAPLFERKRYH
ncbi:hypothetical protein TYRP_012470 [Tyrophagus putrescentiae]|nr:hypothetical protein TYRP_012470 [Tyrophagus putrescentiae]